MRKKNFMARALSGVIALMMAISFLSAQTVSAAVSVPQQVNVQYKGDWYGYYGYQDHEVHTCINYYTGADGKDYYAYCLDPALPGIPSGGGAVTSYDVTVEPSTYQNANAILALGFPNKSPAELGVANEQEAYYVTKMALDMLSEFNDLDSWWVTDPQYQPLLDKSKELVQKATSDPISSVGAFTVTPDSAAAVKSTDGQYWTQTYTVTSALDVSQYAVSFAGDSHGAEIVDTSGQPKTTFNIGDKFMVRVPVSTAAPSSPVNLSINSPTQTGNVIVTEYSDAIGVTTKPGYQSFYLTLPQENQTQFTWQAADAPITPSPETPAQPTDTPAPQTPSTDVEIIKLDAGTDKPLAGAEFKITDATGGVVLIDTTGADGKVTWTTDKLGAYYIDETTAPDGYLLPDDNHKDIVITDYTTPHIVTFHDKKKPVVQVEVDKLEAGTDKPLAGAEFKITDATGGVVLVDTTGSDGKITWTTDKLGAYYIDETTAPDGYLLPDDNHKDIVITDYTTPHVVTFHDKKKPVIQVEVDKLEAGTDKPLAGAEFKITDATGGVVLVDTTGPDGKIIWTTDKLGAYYIDETTAPDGYLLPDDNHKDIVIDDYTTPHVVTFHDEKRPGVTIMKYDKLTNKPLGGAEFSIKKKDGTIVWQGVIDASGNATPPIPSLNAEWYTVEELSPPQGYLLDTASKDFLAMPGQSTSIKFDDLPCPKLEIQKIDAYTKQPLAGASFKIMETDGQTIAEKTTDANGMITLTDLNEGKYSVEETAAPPHYQLDPQHQDVTLSWGKTSTLVYQDIPKGTVTLKKYDEKTGEPLPNAEFSLSRKDGEIIYEGMSDKNGQIIVEDLEDGFYTWTEMAAPDGYLITTPAKDFQIVDGKNVEIKIDNRPRPVLEIIKRDSVTGDPLSGAKFTVTKTEDKTVSTYTTDSTGKLVIKNLDEGIYTVTEISAPNHYLLNQDSQTISLEWGKTKTVIFDDTLKPTLVVQKTNGLTLQPVANAAFSISWENPNGGVTALGSYRTDAKGQIVLPYVNPGWYVVTETAPAPGFSLPKDPTTRIYLSPGQNSYTSEQLLAQQTQTPADAPVTQSSGIQNGITQLDAQVEPVVAAAAPIVAAAASNPDPGITYGDQYAVVDGVTNWPLNSIVIKKTDANTGELLAGATFDVKKVDGEQSGNPGTVIATVTTNNSGVVVLTGVEPGGYVIVETKAPQNYLLNEANQQQVWMKSDGTSIEEVTFSDYPYGSLLISKVDALTGKPLSNAKFKVTNADGAAAGNTNGEYITDVSGQILIENLKPGAYVATEITAPANYSVDTTPQTVNIGTDGKVYKVSFQDQPFGTLVINKFDSQTKAPLGGAEFFVTTSGGNVVGTGNGYFTTDVSGTITIPNLPKGSYIVKETKSPDHYVLDDQSQTVAVDYGKTYSLDFYNRYKSGIQIIKIDAATKQPLKDAHFTVYKQNGEVVGNYSTDGNGLIILDNLSPGWYKAAETKAPDGYLLDDTPQDFQVTDNQFLKLTFEDKKLTSLIIKKLDSSSGAPLAGAKFNVTTIDGTIVGDFSTGADGTINIPTLQPGYYLVKEAQAPNGYLLDESAKTVEVKTGNPTVIEFVNRKMSGMQIIKTDAATGTPLAGAVFSVYKKSGEVIGEYTTDGNGVIILDQLETGWYKVAETRAPQGYIISESPKDVEVTHDQFLRVTFADEKMAALQIKKVDASTGAALAGAVFTVTKQNGEKAGDTYTTDGSGFASVPNLAPGYYVVAETAAPDGYLLDSTAQTVEVKTETPSTVTFSDKAIAGIQIIKTDSVSHNGIAGAEFTITKMNGERIGSFKTGADGTVFAPNLEPGDYIVTETKAASGYILDAKPRNVTVSWGKSAQVEVENTPASGLLIVKTDAQTGKPLSGVVFDVRRSDGTFVAGQILDQNQPDTVNNSPNHTTSPNGDIQGSYTTDANGRILINDLAAGHYTVTERKQLPGYELDTDVHDVTVIPGQLATLQLQNKPLAGLRIKKIDSVTKLPIYGVEFMVFDSNGKVVGTFYSDNNGVVDFSAILTEGRYTIRETRAAPGYYRDDMPRTIEFIAGKVTEVVWENVAEAGQIQVTKVAADDNETNGLEAGTPLEGAIFEVSEYKSGNVVDKFITAANGVGVSKPLPLGRYMVREIQAPPYYKLNDKPMDVTIEFATQIIKLDYADESANIGVSINKVGPYECMKGIQIKYDIKDVTNDSTVPLTDFYWRDMIPTDATRLAKIVTGTYNQSVKFKVTAVTNKGNTMTIADNLKTTKSNVVDCSNAALGLPSDEYVTSVTLYFGNVKAGFAMVNDAAVYLNVLNINMPNGYQFANKCDVGGQYNGEWAIGNATWTSTLYSPSGVKLPKTGW